MDKLYLKLETEKHQAYLNAPPTSDKAVAMAKKALEVSQDNSFSDEEINRFLPDSLKRRNQ
jgi:hypothetical protein